MRGFIYEFDFDDNDFLLTEAYMTDECSVLSRDGNIASFSMHIEKKRSPKCV